MAKHAEVKPEPKGYSTAKPTLPGVPVIPPNQKPESPLYSSAKPANSDSWKSPDARTMTWMMFAQIEKALAIVKANSDSVEARKDFINHVYTALDEIEKTTK